MTPERLAELRAIAAAATPGPWTTSSAWSVRSGRDELVAATSYYNHEADAEFIAAARTAIPALLAEIERLVSERGALRAALREYGPKCCFIARHDGDDRPERVCGRMATQGRHSQFCDEHGPSFNADTDGVKHADVLRSLNEETER